MTRSDSVLARLRSSWNSAWPIWAFLLFAGLAATRWLPAGYARAVVAAPILLVAPGALTLGAVFGERRRPRSVAFVCWAVLLSAVWSAFASVILYALGVRITSASTYWSLLALSAVLAIVTEARLLSDKPGGGHRAGQHPSASDVDLSEAKATAQAQVPPRRTGSYAVIAVAVGACVLAGGVYAYEKLPRPAPVGYTWLAWTAPRSSRDAVIDSAGTKLGFEINRQQAGTATYRLSAEWLGTPSRPLANPVLIRIGPDQTYRGALLVPPLPDGCTYRIVVTLTAPQQTDPQTKSPQTWSINADVHDLNKPTKTCT